MSEELMIPETGLIHLADDLVIKAKPIKKPLSAETKKDPDKVHKPEVKGGFVRLFPTFYRINRTNKVDPKTKEKTPALTFTRVYQEGAMPTEMFSTSAVLFIPLELKSGRKYYAGAYNESEAKAPDCQSENGIVPLTNKFANSCEECPFSKWKNTSPPDCAELPTILGVDMTRLLFEKESPEKAQFATKTAFTVQFTKTAIKRFRELMNQLAEPVPFDDDSYGPIDMTQYLVKMTLERVYDNKGQETNNCLPVFEIVGTVPFEVSEQLLEMFNKPVAAQGNKTVRELFIGRTEPFTGEPTGEVKNEALETKAAPPTAKVAKVAVSKPVAPKEEIVEVKAETKVEAPKPELKAPEPTVEAEDDDEIVF